MCVVCVLAAAGGVTTEVPVQVRLRNIKTWIRERVFGDNGVAWERGVGAVSATEAAAPWLLLTPLSACALGRRFERR